MGKILAFPDGHILETGSHPDLVKLCNILAKEAKSGSLQAIAVACVYEDGSSYADWSAGEDWTHLLNATARLWRRMEDEECQ